MRDLDELFAALRRSPFRSRFRLTPGELAYLNEKGMETILRHAEVFIEQRLAPARPRNDGRQTPMHNHPVFIAQHATATCCRGCLSKWHRIPLNAPLNAQQRHHIIAAIARWLREQAADGSHPGEFLFL